MIMNWLGKMFKKKKKSYNTDGQYKLLIIDDKAELLHHNLGITNKRADELLELCVKIHDEYDILHEALEKLVSECKHTNEIVFTSLMMQRLIDKLNSSNRVHNMLKNMFGRG
jgi:uncharacterized protein (DUF1015 family)